MAPPSSLGERHQSAQATLMQLVVEAILHAWRALFDPRDVQGSIPKLTAAVEAVVQHYGQASSSAALNVYRLQRNAAGVNGRVRPPQLPRHGDVRALVEKSLSALDGTPDAEQKARDSLASQVEQMVLDQSRSAIIDTARADPQAKGWARVTEPDACSFCRLLATRGAVYRSESSGDFRAHTKKPDGSGGTCRCHVEPVFTAYEMTAQARADKAAYDRLTRKYGHSGRRILIAWRQYVEGRPVTGPLTRAN